MPVRPRRLPRPLATVLATVLMTGALVVGSLTLAPAGQAQTPLPVPYQFLPSAIAGGASADAPGTNDWHCRPTRRHPRPVVLVHGTSGNRSTNWQTYGPLLKNNGYCVFALTYGVPAGTPPGLDQFGGRTRMEASAHQLKRFVRRVLRATHARKVDLVGHSQGTLMPDYYVKFLGGRRKVHDYISLAALWNGTTVAGSSGGQSAAAYGAPTDLACAACAEFAPDSRFLAKLRRGGVRVRGVHYTNIQTRYDELVVPYTSGIEPGMTNIVLQDTCPQDFTEHFEIAADHNATQFVLNALDPAHAQPIVCYPVAPFVGGP